MVHGPDNERETGNDGNDDSGDVVRDRLLRRRGHHGGRRCAMSCEHDVHNPAASRACACAHDTSPTISPTGLNNILSESYDSRACASACGRARGTKPHGQFAAWRRKMFGDAGIDPVAAIVDDAVAAYGGRDPKRDRAVWLSVANRIGVDAFRQKIEQMEGIIASYDESDTPLLNTAALFQALLNGRTKHGKQIAQPEGGVS